MLWELRGIPNIKARLFKSKQDATNHRQDPKNTTFSYFWSEIVAGFERNDATQAD